MCRLAGETHFTPKGVSICGGPMAIKMKPLRGWNTGLKPRLNEKVDPIAQF
jgi:hypothetical protein